MNVEIIGYIVKPKSEDNQIKSHRIYKKYSSAIQALDIFNEEGNNYELKTVFIQTEGPDLSEKINDMQKYLKCMIDTCTFNGRFTTGYKMAAKNVLDVFNIIFK
jgi:hypothetical protein